MCVECFFFLTSEGCDVGEVWGHGTRAPARCLRSSARRSGPGSVVDPNAGPRGAAHADAPAGAHA